MSFLEIKNVAIRGLAATVPKSVRDNLEELPTGEAEKLIKNTGIRNRHIASNDLCTSDLCVDAAKSCLDQLSWTPDQVDCLILVTQTPDFLLPATSFSVHERLFLSKNCYSLDISLGCSGFVYGLSVISSLMQNGQIRRGLLLVGDTISRTCSNQDKSTYPLFGDAGTAIALEFENGAPGFKFNFGSDGSGQKAIMVKGGAFRNPFSPKSLEQVDYGDGRIHSDLQLNLDGMDVFSFGINRAPLSVNSLIDYFKIDKSSIDDFFFHQANLFMNEMIRKKLELGPEKVPYSLERFGNVSSATIPLTMISERSSELRESKRNNIACGFGVGLSWGSVYFETDQLVIPQIGYI